MTHSHTTGRRDTSLRLVDQTRLFLLVGPCLLVLLVSCVALFATLGGFRYAAAVLGYPSLWMLMLTVHLLTEPPLIITLPDHPQHRAMIEHQELTAQSPRRRAAGKTALCMLWAAWGGMLYLPLLQSPAIDIAFVTATAGLAIHAIICGVLGFRACQACAYSLLISLERLNLSLASHGNLIAVAPALLRIELRRSLGPATDGRTAISLSLLRMVTATDRGWLSSASQRRIRDQAIAPITGICRDLGVDFDLQEFNWSSDEASEAVPGERRGKFTWYEWELWADMRCGRFARSQFTLRFPSTVTTALKPFDAARLERNLQ